jgi:hypothetical protein
MSFIIEETEYSIITNDIFRYPISVRIVPGVINQRYVEIIPKLTIDDTYIAVRACLWNASRNSVGIDCAFALHNN